MIILFIAHNSYIISRYVSINKPNNKMSFFLIIKKGWAYRGFFESNYIIVLILLSILLGSAKAKSVKDNSEFTFIQSGSEDQKYVVFLTTSNGLLVWNRYDEKTSFLSWESIYELKE